MPLIPEWMITSQTMKRIIALQAQEPPSPYIALWNRMQRFDPGHLDSAFRSHEVVKASLMRELLG